MIKTINYSLLLSRVLFTLAQRCLTLYNEFLTEDNGLKVFRDKLAEVFGHYAQAFERETSSPYTERKANKDNKRDNAFIAFRTYIEACSYHDFENWIEYAEDILAVIQKHGWTAYKLGYKKETAALTNLVSEIRNKHEVALNALSADIWLDELEAANEAFEAVKKESVTNTTTEATISETRPELEQAMRSLFTMTDLLYQANPTDGLKKLITDLNELISQTMATAKAAATRRRNQETEAAKNN
ncbi:hypothetical protein DMA11_08570 [Marinilabiliaceae bacterium JC017]|nr:hypothetical protein DMA11_08570 [Marinilabiliaceae bacterium JC017]